MSLARTAVAPSAERMLFLKAWAANPLKVAAIAPSSRALSALVARQVDPPPGRSSSSAPAPDR